MNVGDKVLIEVEITSIIQTKNGISYGVAIDPEKSYLGTLTIKDEYIRFQGINNGQSN